MFFSLKRKSKEKKQKICLCIVRKCQIFTAKYLENYRVFGTYLGYVLKKLVPKNVHQHPVVSKTCSSNVAQLLPLRHPVVYVFYLRNRTNQDHFMRERGEEKKNKRQHEQQLSKHSCRNLHSKGGQKAADRDKNKRKDEGNQELLRQQRRRRARGRGRGGGGGRGGHRGQARRRREGEVRSRPIIDPPQSHYTKGTKKSPNKNALITESYTNIVLGISFLMPWKQGQKEEEDKVKCPQVD